MNFVRSFSRSLKAGFPALATDQSESESLAET